MAYKKPCSQTCGVTCLPNNPFGLEDDGTNLVTLMRKNAKSRFLVDKTYWIHGRYFNLCSSLLGKQSITLSFIMGCEKCDWTSVERATELWRDGSQLGVINICYSVGSACDGGLMDASITSAVSLTLGS